MKTVGAAANNMGAYTYTMRCYTHTLHIQSVPGGNVNILGGHSIGQSKVRWFAGSNPAEAVGFLRAEKSSARLPSEGK
jgi:hypothetical protein